MDQAWRSINGFIVSFTSSFGQWKILFYTEIKKKKKSHPWKLSITIEKEYIPLLNSNCQRLPRLSGGQRREVLVLTDSEGPGLIPLEANISKPCFFFKSLVYSLFYLCGGCGKLS